MQLFKISYKQGIILFFYAFLNSLLSFGIIYIINKTLAGDKTILKDYMGIVFISFIIYTYLLNIIFQKYLNKYSFKLLYENEKTIFKKILQVPLSTFEKLGPQRFFTAIEDIRSFAFLPYTITHTVNSILMLVLCLTYMFTLSTLSAFIVIVLMLLVGGCYFIVMNSMSKQIERLKEYNDDYYKYVDDVMKGFKMLKLSFLRKDSLMSRYLIPNRDNAEQLDFNTNYIFSSINLISQYGLYFVIGVILFLMPYFGILSKEDVISYIIIILFISGPINNLINLQQMYTGFIVSNRRIQNFLIDFEVKKEKVEQSVEVEKKNFETLKFKNISYAYKNNVEDDNFTLGPINLNIDKGETIFIIGGNGSGKSTFINILTGLYIPTKGDIDLNNSTITQERQEIQDLISVVFTDNHIFSNNYEDYKLKGNKNYKGLLELMKMNNVVLDDEESSARRKFSKGQSKRMSLIFALLEEKPILVLDEWAADQDPQFRKFFYEELIPKFKKEGKTIIAVTHDDAYFHQADRILKFSQGRITDDFKSQKEFDKVSNI